jgi:hypothetical protein
MCLSVDETLHKGTRKGFYCGKAYAPCRVAQRDILVYKILRKDFISPFQRTQWTPGEMNSARMGTTSGKWNEIEVGLHALTSKRAAYDYKRGLYMNYYKTFPAVIPKGSRVFFGDSNQIASNQMVVFKNVADLEAVYGKIGDGVKKDLIAK